MADDTLPRVQLVGDLVGIGDTPQRVVLTAQERRNDNLFTDVTSTPYTVGPGDRFLLVDDDTVGGAVTINLPPAGEWINRTIDIKKLGSTGNVTMDGDGSETIDGSATLVNSTQFASFTLFSDGTEWWIK